MLTQNRRLIAIVCTVLFLLTIPLTAMQFTPEVNWTTSDFLVAAILLLSTGLACEVVLRKVKAKRNRLILCFFVLAICLLVWAELAVGIFSTPFAGQ